MKIICSNIEKEFIVRMLPGDCEKCPIRQKCAIASDNHDDTTCEEK